MRRTASAEMDIGSATIRRVPQQTTVGADFARAFGEKDSARIRKLLHPGDRLPRAHPEPLLGGLDPDDVVEILFGDWLEDTDHVDEIEGIEADTVADRERVGYRFIVSNADGRFLVEQQAYLSTRDGQIDWIRVVCSGLRRPSRPR